MPLDHFKTQVLLLHSDERTLDSLSSGFNDRYTVHCATSGIEALTTLGETPINVIISAKDLPGMSGVEALREAKKRSPETIGILLAGKSDEGLEALVGEKEVFQVVYGDISGDKLPRLVDSATQQMRLMALAESANDTAAEPDETAAEHIVMETSENGSTIISDGSGHYPALDPKRVAAAVAAGAQAVDVLVLTKDQEFLATVKESARGLHKVHYANTLKQADESIRNYKVGVAVIDAAIVGNKVEQLTQHLRKNSPRLVSIVAGRRDDGDMLMDLINRGKVYRFLLKPMSPGRTRLAVEASVKHHLEAPDAAFKTNGVAAPPKPLRKPPVTPPVKAAPKVTPKPEPAAPPAPKSPAPSAKKPPPAPAKQSSVPAPLQSKPTQGNPGSSSPVDAPKTVAFGNDDSSLKKTVTGLITAVSKKLASDDKAKGSPASMRDTLAGLELPPASGGAVGFLLKNPKMIAAAAAAIVVLAVLLLFAGGEDDAAPVSVEQPSTSSTPAITEADVVFEAPSSDPEVDLEAELASAETALLESRLDDAEAALQRVIEADPDNSRVVFLTAQLQQAQLRGRLADARAAIRDSRFEDAGNALARARAIGLEDTSEIDAIAEELDAARGEQRVDETLALATARLEEGRLIQPSNDNARYYYELVLSNDPTNAAARQGLNVIASKLVLQARAEIDAGALNAAENLLKDARAIDAASGDLAATDAALVAARDAIAERERQAAEARRKAAADKRAAEQRAAEQRAAAERQEATQTEQTTDEVVAPETGQESATEVASKATPTPADSSDQGPISISTLTRTRYVAPRYPRTAQRRGLNGWVDVVFTIAADGTIRDAEVRNSEPERIFDSAAIRAIEKWEFEPIIEDGVAAEKRAGVRMVFALE